MYYKVPKKQSEKLTAAVENEHKFAALECLKAINTTYSLDLYNYLNSGRLDLIDRKSVV